MDEILKIDCDADPFKQEGEVLLSHIEGGQLEWKPGAVRLWQSESQAGDGPEGKLLARELEQMPVLNANVLWWLLDHRELIPKEWEDGRSVCFWGTTFKSGLADPYLYCLTYGERGWDAVTQPLHHAFDARFYAALRAA